MGFRAAGFLVVISFLMASSTKAADVTFGLPTFSGAGCSSADAEAILVPDGTALSVVYSEFKTEAAPRKSSSKSCRLVIPMYVPTGVRVVMTSTDYEGFLQLPSRAVATLSADMKLTQGSRFFGAAHVCSVKVGPIDGTFYKHQDHSYSLRSGCGGTYQLQIDTRIGISNASKVEAAAFTIDATNIGAANGAMNLALRYERCR